MHRPYRLLRVVGSSLVLAIAAPSAARSQIVTIDTVVTGCATTTSGEICAWGRIQATQDYGRPDAFGNPFTSQSYSVTVRNSPTGPNRLAMAYLDVPFLNTQDRFDLEFGFYCCALPGGLLSMQVGKDASTRPEDTSVRTTLGIVLYAIADDEPIFCQPIAGDWPPCGFTSSKNGAYQIRLRQPSFASVSLTAAPEPSTWALLGTGLVSLGVLARRRRPRPER